MKRLVFSLILMSGFATVSEAMKYKHWTFEEHNRLISAVYQKLRASKNLPEAEDPIDQGSAIRQSGVKSLSGSFFEGIVVGDRSAEQCFERWRERGPHINRGPWSQQEDAILLTLLKQKRERTDYSEIAKRDLYETRSGKQVMSRMKLLERANFSWNFRERKRYEVWRPNDDDILIESVMRNGLVSWNDLKVAIENLSIESLDDEIKQLRNYLGLADGCEDKEVVKKLENRFLEIRNKYNPEEPDKTIPEQGWNDIFNLIPGCGIRLAILKELPCSEIGSKKIDWEAVKQQVAVQGRSKCKERWDRVLNPRISDKPWTEDECNRLMRAVGEYGVHKWSQVAQAVGSRSDVQCKYKYNLLQKAREVPVPAPVQAQEVPALSVQYRAMPGGVCVFIPLGYRGLLPFPIPQLTNTTTQPTSGTGVAHTDPVQESVDETEKPQE